METTNFAIRAAIPKVTAHVDVVPRLLRDAKHPKLVLKA
tara:strand:- start:928 stop:1044 length:117 start_codon:yes stop_codon:yes gene_type:complete